MAVARYLKTQMKVAPFVGRRDYKEALRILESELTGTSEDVPYLELIAQCLWQTGNMGKVIETAKKALEFDPNNFEMARMLSLIFAEHEDYDQTVEYLKIGLSNYPSEMTTTLPAWACFALKHVGKFSARWKQAGETATEDLQTHENDRINWQTWASEFLAWHEVTLKNSSNNEAHAASLSRCVPTMLTERE